MNQEQVLLKITLLLIREWDGFQAAMQIIRNRSGSPYIPGGGCVR